MLISCIFERCLLFTTPSFKFLKVKYSNHCSRIIRSLSHKAQLSSYGPLYRGVYKISIDLFFQHCYRFLEYSAFGT